MINRNFTPFPILITERLTLRSLSMDDQHDVFDLRSDPATNQYLNRAPSKTIEDAIHFIEQINDSIKNNQSIYWVISLTSSKTFVGTICLYAFSDEKSSCEIGYELMSKFQGQGIMKEAAEAVIDYVFQTLKLKKILAFTHCENQNSTHLLLKFNFVISSETDQDNPDLNIFTLTK